ncbi:MAG: hypothetical protein RBS48_04035 [Ignavibacteriaceae bacterium]|jgi:hypothetical protein|nr:hypothetical protein [Ignavibacteriaceae bacterium]
MPKKWLTLIFIFTLALTINLSAQDEDEDDWGTTDDDDDYGWAHNWEWNGYDWLNWKFDRPFMELNYGIGDYKHKDMFSKFASAGSWELKLGYSDIGSADDNNIVDFNESFVFVSHISSRLSSQERKITELPFDNWRFGIGKREGYGYDLGALSILPYTQSGFVWTRVEMEDYPAGIWITPLDDYFPSPGQSAYNDYKILQRYDKDFRFGTLVEGGVRFETASVVSISAGYEAAVIFPRHLFWKHLGSLVIEETGKGALEYFIERVMDSSPAAAPIINVILKSAYSYAFYALKKDNMNWPFNTEKPLTYETFKFGVTFVF